MATIGNHAFMVTMNGGYSSSSRFILHAHCVSSKRGLKIQISLAPRRTGSHGARSLSNRGKQFPSPMAFATSFMCAVFNPPQTP